MKLNSEVPSGFIWTFEHLRKGELIDVLGPIHNLLPTQGLNALAGYAFKSVVQIPTWYIALFEGDYTPLPTEVASTVAASSTECTAYNETTRVPWVPGVVASGALDNTASKAIFTLNANKNLHGGYLISSAPKAGTTGVLMSLVRFPSPKGMNSGDVLRATCGIAFTSV